MTKSTLYTRTGDRGTTSLVGGTRVSKASPRLEAYGTVDELNSHIGLLLAMDAVDAEMRATLTGVQHRLFNLGSMLATEPESKYQPKGIVEEDVAEIERAIDAIDADLPKFRAFVLPGGTKAAAQANVARTVARRCERRMVQMTEAGISVEDEAMRYVNRLSDYLFAVGRALNHNASHPETVWQG